MKNTLKFYFLVMLVALSLQKPQREVELSFLPAKKELNLKIDQLDEEKKEFVLNNHKIWIREGLLNNIAPSIYAAQAILESGFGTSKLAREFNNLHGAKYRSGTKYSSSSKYFDKQENTYSRYFSFPSTEASIEYHSTLLNKRYSGVIGKSWKKAAQVLEDRGYATTSNYCTVCNRGRYMNHKKITKKGCEGACKPSYSSKLKFGEKIYADKLQKVIRTYGLDALDQ